jgi:hypothetical protein
LCVRRRGESHGTTRAWLRSCLHGSCEPCPAPHHWPRRLGPWRRVPWTAPRTATLPPPRPMRGRGPHLDARPDGSGTDAGAPPQARRPAACRGRCHFVRGAERGSARDAERGSARDSARSAAPSRPGAAAEANPRARPAELQRPHMRCCWAGRMALSHPRVHPLDLAGGLGTGPSPGPNEKVSSTFYVAHRVCDDLVDCNSHRAALATTRLIIC